MCFRYTILDDVATQFLKKIPLGNHVYQTRVRDLYYPQPLYQFYSFKRLPHLHPQPPHASTSLMPHAFLMTLPPPPSRLTPPWALPHLTSRLTPGDIKSTVLLLSLSSLGCAKGRQLSLSLCGSGCANFLWENKKKLGSFFLYKSPLFSLALLYHSPSRSNRFSV